MVAKENIVYFSVFSSLYCISRLYLPILSVCLKSGRASVLFFIGVLCLCYCVYQARRYRGSDVTKGKQAVPDSGSAFFYLIPASLAWLLLYCFITRVTGFTVITVCLKQERKAQNSQIRFYFNPKHYHILKTNEVFLYLMRR